MELNVKRKLNNFLIVLTIIAVILIINHFARHTGEFIDGKFFWRGSYYHEINSYSYEYKQGERLGKTKNHEFNISSIEGDDKHIFLKLWNFSDDFTYIRDDYEISSIGEITTIYIDYRKYDNKEFCDAMDTLLFSGFINDKREKYIIETDEINYLTDYIMLSFNGCPVGTEFVGYIGIINNKWVYIPVQEIKTDKNGFAKTTSFTCYVIDDYDKLSIIKEYYKPTNHNANSEE